jgi:hypothetical protein
MREQTVRALKKHNRFGPKGRMIQGVRARSLQACEEKRGNIGDSVDVIQAFLYNPNLLH